MGQETTEPVGAKPYGYWEYEDTTKEEIAALPVEEVLKKDVVNEVKEIKTKHYGNIWTIDRIAKFCKKRQEYEMDFSIVVTGEKGAGKSMLAYQLAKAIDVNFTLERNIIITPDPQEIAERIDAMEKYPAIVIDEAISSFYTQRWNTEGQKSFDQYINMFARKDKYAVMFFCIPHLSNMRGTMVMRSVNAWIHLLTPGFGVLMIKSTMPIGDPFMLGMLKANWEWESRTQRRFRSIEQQDISFQAAVYQRMPTFLGFVSFDPLPSDEYEAYLKYWREHRDEIREVLFKDSEIQRLQLEAREVRLRRTLASKPSKRRGYNKLSAKDNNDDGAMSYGMGGDNDDV